MYLDVCSMEDKKEKKRTILQNKSLYLLFQMIADECNNAGYDMQEVLKQSVSVPCTGVNIKEDLFKPIMYALLKKSSTTKLTTKEIDEVFDVLNRHLAEKLKIHVPFPSVEEVLWKLRFEEESKKGKK